MSSPTSDPRPILTAAAMRAAEQAAIDAGATIETLMARAGAAVAEAAWRYGAGEVLILCGPGNNGGDGYVAARLLAARGVAVRAAAAGEPRTAAALEARAGWQGPVERIADAGAAPVLVDALFGTGLTRALDEAVAGPLARLAEAARFTMAVDLPSGVSTDDGRVLGAVPAFDMTIAMGALKPAHRLMPAAARMGRIMVAGIDIGAVSSPLGEVMRPRLRAPGPEDHKYTRGKVSVVSGGMAGAALLSAGAAQRAGAGYVELLGPAEPAGPHALVRRAWEASALDDERIGAVVIGPGLGADRASRDRLDAALASGRSLVLDAGALTLIGKGGLRRVRGAHVLTPHEGEFARLFGDDGRDPLARARAAAERCGAVVLLKGAASIVAHPDGRAAIAPVAPAWLASAGTGDVLSGIVGAMIAGGRAPFEAAQAALWLHAEAARLAGPFLIADDLIAHLPAAAMACL